MSKVIAIDFDETITDNTPYPIMGNLRPEAIKYIKLLYFNGYTLILWTSRQDEYLQEALHLLNNNNLLKYFTFINDDGLNRNCRKIVADFYIDDRAYMGKLNWKKIYKYIAGAHNLKLNYENKCQILHGHNWLVTVYCKAKELDENGMIIDFKHIKNAIMDKLDHQYINDVVDFNPTAENMSRWICEQIPDCYKVSVQESEGNIAIYKKED